MQPISQEEKQAYYSRPSLEHSRKIAVWCFIAMFCLGVWVLVWKGVIWLAGLFGG